MGSILDLATLDACLLLLVVGYVVESQSLTKEQ